jgi:hypothetical protein
LGSTPPKNDFNNVYGASYISGGQLFAYFGGEFLESGGTGTATVGIWFLQNNVNLVAGGTFSGTHRDNDVLLVVDFGGNRNTATVTAYKWVSSGTNHLVPLSGGGSLNYNCVGGDASVIGTQCVTWNTGAIAGLPFPNQAGGNTAPQATFFEGGVNFNNLFGPGVTIPCFTTTIFESRSSNMPSSELKDLALSSFPVCSAAASASCPSIDEAPAGSGLQNYVATITITVTNSGISAQTVQQVTAASGVPAGALVTTNVGAGITVPAGGAANIIVTVSNIPRAGFDPVFTVTFTSTGPAPITVHASCPNPPALTYTVTRSCAKPAVASFDLVTGYTYDISGSVTANVGSLICTYTDTSAIGGTFSTTLSPVVPSAATKTFTYQVKLAAAPFTPSTGSISCTDLRGIAVSGQTSVPSTNNCPPYTHGLTVAKTCGTGTFDAASGLMTFTITVAVTNTGQDSLFNCKVTDLSQLSVNPANPISPVGGSTTLAVGGQATFSYTISQTFAQQSTAGQLSDLIATVNCQAPGNVPFSSSSAAGVSNPTSCKITFSPGISVTKACAVTVETANIDTIPPVPALYLRVGFDVTVHNTGNVDLTNCALTDTRTDGTSQTYAAPLTFTSPSTQRINVGGTATFHSSYVPRIAGSGNTFSDTAAVTCVAVINSALTASASATQTCRLCP